MGLGILIITGLDACLIGISIIELAYYVLKNHFFTIGAAQHTRQPLFFPADKVHPVLYIYKYIKNKL